MTYDEYLTRLELARQWQKKVKRNNTIAAVISIVSFAFGLSLQTSSLAAIGLIGLGLVSLGYGAITGNVCNTPLEFLVYSSRFNKK